MNSSDERYFIYKLLQSYTTFDEDEEQSKIKTLTLLETTPDCFQRTCYPGHITGSALVINEDLTHCILNHHAKSDKWFHLGGHSDGDPNTLSVALREATEESGLESLGFFYQYTGIWDIDIQRVPARGDQPEHFHHDIIMLLVADMKEKLKITTESKDLKWVMLEHVKDYNTQPAFLRLIEKVIALREI